MRASPQPRQEAFCQLPRVPDESKNELLDRSPPTGANFTEKQGQYLAFIWAYSLLSGRPPAECDMQHYFRVTHGRLAS